MSIAVWRRWQVAWLVSHAALAVSALLAACSAGRPPAPLDDLAEAYVRITLQLAQHRPNLVDAWLGPSAWRPGPRVPVADVRVTLDDLIKRVDTLRPAQLDPTEAPRAAYLRGQLRALSLVVRRLLGESPRFEEEFELSFGRPWTIAESRDLSDERAALERELPGSGPLAERYASFRQQFLVPADRVERVFAAAIDGCRKGTIPHVTLPPDERVDVQFEAPIEWDAAAEYLGGHQTRVRVASRRGHDLAELLRVACHETYAGHHLQHVLIDDALVKGRGWTEFQLTPAFGPHLLIAEGAAEVAVDLALPESFRAGLYREALMPLAGLPSTDADRLARIETLAAPFETVIPSIVASYLNNEISTETASQQLRTRALLPDPERFLPFAERHRTTAIAYPAGRFVVAQWIRQAATDAERWRRLQDIFTLKPFRLG